MPITFRRVVPILRMFDVDKAGEFYVDFLGCNWDWEHRFGDNFPLYAQVSRADLVLHLSEHHGDATPGATVQVITDGVRELHAELRGKDARFNKPEIIEDGIGTRFDVIDPFMNRLRFVERPA